MKVKFATNLDEMPSKNKRNKIKNLPVVKRTQFI